MKTNILLILVVMVISISCGGMVGSSVAPQTTVTALQTGSTRYLLDVFFENAVNGCAVGDSGTILTTTNGGATWSKIQLDTPVVLTTYIVHNGTHYVSGWNYIAQGGGLTTLIRQPYYYGVGGASKFLVSSGNLFLVSGFGNMQGETGATVVWNPSSAVWQYVATLSFGNFPGKPAKLNDSVVLYPSRQSGFREPAIYKINTKAMVRDTFFAVDFSLLALSKAPFTTRVVGVGSGKTARSTDDGMTWNYQNTPNGEVLNDVAMISATEGYACGEGGALLKTTDGGASWSSVSSGTTKNLRSIFFPNASVGYVVGEAGTIIKITPEDS